MPGAQAAMFLAQCEILRKGQSPRLASPKNIVLFIPRRHSHPSQAIFGSLEPRSLLTVIYFTYSHFLYFSFVSSVLHALYLPVSLVPLTKRYSSHLQRF